MKLVKSLLLGSAAGFVAMSGAQAADLPSRKAAPAEYVRVCSQYGAGFFFIPGTDTCIQIGGRARYELQWYDGAVNSRAQSKLGHRTLGNIRLDARTPTPWGTLRTFVRLEMARRTGILRSGSAERWGLAVESNDATSPAGQGRAQTQVYLDAAFIQWAGITAGRAPSFFEFACGGVLFNGLAGSCLGATNLLAYTATFGPGFSATISVEDGVERNGHVVADFGLPAGAPFYATAVAAFGAQPNGGINGSRVPDIVANIRVDQPWGSAILAGAAHLISPQSQNFVFPAVAPDSVWGWAAMAGLKINLPMIAPGDALFLEATYADGAIHYIDSAPVGFGVRLNAIKTSNAYFTGDAVVDQVTGRIAKAKGYGLLASFLHYWRPDLRSGFSVGYTKHNNPTTALGSVADYSLFAAGANIIWSPVRAFDIGLEGVYYRLNGDSCVAPNFGCVLGTGGVNRTSDDAFLVRIRLQRDF